jgi:hypothetical protein
VARIGGPGENEATHLFWVGSRATPPRCVHSPQRHGASRRTPVEKRLVEPSQCALAETDPEPDLVQTRRRTEGSSSPPPAGAAEATCLPSPSGGRLECHPEELRGAAA